MTQKDFEEFVNNSKLVKELKEKKHKGTVIPWGKNFYLWDNTEEVVYNLKTEYKLKWLKRPGCRPEYEGFVFLCDGHGNKDRLYKDDFRRIYGGLTNET